jgi:lysophospholipase L1-like esterase
MTIKLAVVGSSHSVGLGVHGRSFAVRVAERLDAETLQLSRSAQTVAQVEPRTLAAIADFGPDLVIVSFGAAEGHVHPSRLLQALLDRFAPRSWRGPDGVEPRPYYSRRRGRRLAQRVMSDTKVLLKRVLIAATGGFHRLPSADFDAALRELLDRLGPATKVLVGLWHVDQRMFPRSNPVLCRNDSILRTIAAERDDICYVHTADAVRYWDDFLDDHAHLNEAGHGRIAELIVAATRNRADVGA